MLDVWIMVLDYLMELVSRRAVVWQKVAGTEGNC